MKVEIIDGPARQADKVVGTIRFLRENDDANLGEFRFSEDLDVVAKLTTDEFEAHAINKIKPRLVAEKRERDWAKVQEVLAPLVKAEEVPE